MIKKWMPQYQGKPMPPDEIDICPKCGGTGLVLREENAQSVKEQDITIERMNKNNDSSNTAWK